VTATDSANSLTGSVTLSAQAVPSPPSILAVPLTPSTGFTVAPDGSLWSQDAGSPTGTELSPAGTIQSAAAGTDAGGNAAVFALAADHSLWRFAQGAGWQLLSGAGTMRAITASAGAAVSVVAGDNGLWQFDGSAWARLAFG
jgi:hypothetical protein